MSSFIKHTPAVNATDKELVDLFKKTGDSNYLGTLYQRYIDLVFGVCMKYYKDAEKSKDAVMDIYEVLSKKLPLHEVEYFKGWLHTLARNHCLIELRSKHIHTTELQPEFMQSAQESHLDNSILEQEATFNQLGKCMEQLPGQQSTSIRLFFLEKKSYQEIAAITGLEWNKIRSDIQNGKRNLKICMEKTQAISKPSSNA